MTRTVDRGRAGSRAIAAIGTGLAFLAAIRVVTAGDTVLPYPPEPREWVLAAFGALVGVRIVAYTSRNPVGWLLLGTGLTASTTVLAATFDGPPVVHWIRIATWWPVYALLLTTAVVFPGTRPSRGGRYLLTVVTVAAMTAEIGFGVAAWSDPVGFLAPVDTGVDPWLALAAAAAATGVVIGGVGAVVRMTTTSRQVDGRTRRALVWSAAAVLLLVAADTLDVLGVPLVWVLGALAFPVAAVVAIVRYGLYDMDLIVHRSLVFGAATAAILAIYAGVVALLAGLVPVAAAGAAAAVAVVVAQPVRNVAQAGVDRLVYGERREPYRVMTQLGTRLEGLSSMGATTPLGAVVEAVGHSLRLPSVTISYPQRPEPVAEYGTSRGRPTVSVPVDFQGRHLADLRVEQRSPDEELTRPETELIENLARQAGPVVHAVRLAEELQSSRERIVLAREEERRRLRRDLHDGLGPSLTGIRMQLLSVARTLAEDSPLRPRLAAISSDMSRSVTELGSVVDDLRPPALDAGLAAAIELETARFRGPTALSIEISAGDLGRLPAGVEVAALRIVLEALTNVVRHAAARTCRVVLRRTDVLELWIVDDGIGLPASPGGGGVGLSSMRERAVELGGTLAVGPGPGGGCYVVARLPLPTDG